MRKFLKRLGKNWWLVVLLVFTTIVNVVADFIIPLTLGQIIETLQGPKDYYQYVLNYSVGMVLFAFISGASGIITGKIASLVTSRMMSKVREDLFEKINAFSLREMNKFSVSSLITRTTNDITNISNTYNYLFRFILYGPLMALCAIIYLASVKSGQMTLLIVGALILFAIILFIMLKVTLPKFNSIQKKIDKVNLVTKENLEGLRVVRAYNAENYQKEKFEAINDDLMVTDRFANRSINALLPTIQLIMGLLTVSISWLGSYLISGKNMIYSQLAIVSEYAGMLLLGFILIVGLFIQLPRSIVCAKRINDVIETPIQIQDGPGATPSEVGTIEFKNVTFSYPGGELPVIKNVSFKVNRGETIAFIGATGSGKTTLINLLPRFYDATEGEVLVDGVNVKEYKLDDLLSKFGYVPQKPYLFHDTLRNNVCLGKKDATEEELNRALEISQSNEFVSKLPNGINYEISQGGKNVSGGQRQRLSIARAIILNPEIFIFDDSFSALDYKTDKVLRGMIKSECKGATSVIVAQRVGTILDADQIVVLDNGNVMGIGKHKELLASCPVYKEIALSQLSKEELEK